MNCGYSKHVEACHIRRIADFPASATVGEINHADNMLVLCPNCHWEFDAGLLSVAAIRGRASG
jgi:predicted restriction endonuclease